MLLVSSYRAHMLRQKEKEKEEEEEGEAEEEKKQEETQEEGEPDKARMTCQKQASHDKGGHHIIKIHDMRGRKADEKETPENKHKT